MKEILVSVIIPVYNTENYLDRCIQSLINQTLKNIEIILIDDESTDKSLEVCRNYEKEFENIKVYTQKHSGQAAARNYGMSLACGKYIGFVDSDDFVDQNMYKYLYDISENNGCSVGICGHEKVHSNLVYMQQVQDDEIEIISNEQEILKRYLLQKITSFSCDKIYNKSFIENNNISFSEGTYFEDINFVLKVLARVNKAAVGRQKLYMYVQRNDSTTYTRDLKHMTDFNTQVKLFYKNINNDFDKNSINIEIRTNKFIYSNMYLNMLKDLGLEEEVKNIFNKLPRNLIVFGASSAGILMKYYCDIFNIKIEYFSDNDSGKWNGNFKKIKVISPNELRHIDYTETKIYIASMYYKEIYEQLSEYGLEKNIVDLALY